MRSSTSHRWRAWPRLVTGSDEAAAQWLLESGADVIQVLPVSQRTVLLLTRDGIVYKGQTTFSQADLKSRVTCACLVPSNLELVDVDTTSKANMSDIQWEALFVMEDDGSAVLVDPISCQVTRHVISSPQQLEAGQFLNTQFRLCSGGQHHVVLVDCDGQVWSGGIGPQAGHLQPKSSSAVNKTDASEEGLQIARIDFFQGVRVTAVATGDDFTLVLVERKSGCDADQLLASSSGSISSCPLGLPIEQNSGDYSEKVELRRDKNRQRQSLPVLDYSAGNRIDSNDDENQQLGDEEEGDKSGDVQQVERLARSGMYLNPTDAFKFLSNQLSWIGIGVNAEEAAVNPATVATATTTTTSNVTTPLNTPEVQEETSQAKSNIFKASSIVSDGMKAVGETVSKLSKSFSSERNVELALSDIIIGLDGAESVSDLSKTAPPLSPLPVVRSEQTRSNSLRRSATQRLGPASTKKVVVTPKMMSHRRSQSASFGLNTLAEHEDVASAAVAESSSSSSSSPDVFATEVWTWGKGRRGQQGQGDMLDRLQPSPVDKLTGLGVLKVACGARHSLAMTVTGRVYGWGENAKGQACPHCTLAVCSIPQEIHLPVGETANDIAAVNNLSFILTDVGSIYCCGGLSGSGKTSMVIKVCPLDDELSDEKAVRKILCTRDSLYGSVADMYLPLCNFKALEKLFLHKMSEITHKVLDSLCSRSSTSSSDPNERARGHLLKAAKSLIDVVGKSVSASWDLHCIDECGQLTIMKQPEVLAAAMEEYTKRVCDCLVVECVKIEGIHESGQQPMAETVLQMLQKLCHIHQTEESPDMLQFLLLDPTNQLQHYLSCLKSMVLAGRKSKEVAHLQTCDRIEKCIQELKAANKAIEKEKKLTQNSREFWDMSGSKLSALKTPSRRIIMNSRATPIGVANATSFSKNWIVLMNDVLVHVGYSSYAVHPLQTVWIESHQVSSPSKRTHGTSTSPTSTTSLSSDAEISLVLPEDTLVLVAPCAEARTEWFISLQKCILDVLGHHQSGKIGGAARQVSFTPPIIRNTSYTFSKTPDLKGAEYKGAWMHGKIHGQGIVSWPDGRCYSGQLRQNQKHGRGRMETVDACGGRTVFDGQWKCDKFEGYGSICYPNGDVYQGMVKDGKSHGQGVLKQGKFMGSGASVYIGEWCAGLRSGYGVLDDIIAGDKYMGMWSSDMKNGSGCVVTLDGVYYEGTFSHNKMTGRGLMMFEDETSYEGNFADAGVFSGAGILTYANGDRLEGSFYGNYTDGMKFNGTVYKTVRSPHGHTHLPSLTIEQHKSEEAEFNRNKIGKHSVSADRKWTCIFNMYQEILCLPDRRAKVTTVNTPLVWEQLAIHINQNKNAANLQVNKAAPHNVVNSSMTGSIMRSSLPSNNDVMDGLEMIPDYYSTELSLSYWHDVQSYLAKAFVSPFHPLASLMTTLCDCFTATYGGVRVHPRLLKHAVEELRSLCDGVYYIVRALFPSLPRFGAQLWLLDVVEQEESRGEMVSASTLLHPHLLPRIHSSIFMLYALHYKKDDDEYWARILKWNRHPDIALLSFLGVDQKFWLLESSLHDTGREGRRSISLVRDVHFVKAIETLQQLKTTFTPLEKLTVLLETFREINRIGQDFCGSEHCWSMDDLFPVFQYIVVRARILQLGAEIHMIEDLMESYMFNGEYGIMFTTLQASYYQILKESLSMY